MTRKTIYVVVEDRKTGRRLGEARLKGLAAACLSNVNRLYWSTYRGDYISAGTRFDVAGKGGDELHKATPVLKVRGEPETLSAALQIASTGRTRVVGVYGHDRKAVSA